MIVDPSPYQAHSSSFSIDEGYSDRVKTLLGFYYSPLKNGCRRVRTEQQQGRN
jgi:hypothetical protein